MDKDFTMMILNVKNALPEEESYNPVEMLLSVGLLAVIGIIALVRDLISKKHAANNLVEGTPLHGWAESDFYFVLIYEIFCTQVDHI